MKDSLTENFELLRRIDDARILGWDFAQDRNYVVVNVPDKLTPFFGATMLAGKSLEEACSFIDGIMRSFEMLRNNIVLDNSNVTELLYELEDLAETDSILRDWSTVRNIVAKMKGELE